MQKIQNGHFVKVDYTGSLADGEVFDSSEGREPMEIEMGAGQVIPGFEQALMGMAENETKTVSLAPEEAYGERDESLLRRFERSQVPPEMNPQVGDTVALTTQQGDQIPARITEADDEAIVLDLNHPLAGQQLIFNLRVVSIGDAPTAG
ncbi:MAG: peptidylprolyl isomerase [Desulfatitalea sp.]|nr:peptidylprolyl isomerase [Desulfatitalea sp.]